MSILSLMERAGEKIPNGLVDNKISTVFQATGLNWTIDQQPVSTPYGWIKDVVANYRSDNQSFLGFVHPKRYQIVNNLDAFNFIDELPNFTLEKVGMFDGGRKVFVVGKSMEQICINSSDDMVDFYLTFLHGHDGKSSIKFILCPIRMFCMNQLNLMMKTSRFKFSITHVGNVEFKLQQIQSAIADSRLYIDDLQEVVTNMINHKPNLSIQAFVNMLLPTEEDDSQRQLTYTNDVKETIIDLYENKDDLQNYKGTSFGMLSAVSDYISHANPRRNASEHTINNTFINNMEGNDIIERARSILLAA